MIKMKELPFGGEMGERGRGREGTAGFVTLTAGDYYALLRYCLLAPSILAEECNQYNFRT